MDSRDYSAMTGGAKDQITVTLYYDEKPYCPKCERRVEVETMGSHDCCSLCNGTELWWEHEIALPTTWEVCPLCQGDGHHVNPSIDAHGLSAEDFYDDPDFAEDYFSGVYDQPCNECHGRTTVKVANLEAMPEELRDAYQQQCEDVAEMYLTMEAERRMGA